MTRKPPQRLPENCRRSVLATAASVGLLRDVTETFLRKYGLDHVIDDSRVIVSELATNAVNAVPGTVVVLDVRLLQDRPELLIELWDQSSRRPVQVPAGPDDETGRGLAIVGGLAADWGVRYPPNGGKTVWATLKVP